MSAPTVPSLAASVGANTLIIHREMQGATAFLTPHGEIIYGCVTVLGHALDEIPGGTQRLVLDMAGVTFMDSTGLQFLEHLEDYSRLYDVPVRTADWSDQPRRVLEISGLSTTVIELGLDTAPPAARHDQPAPSTPEHGLPASGAAVERAEQVQRLTAEVRQLHQAIASRPVIDQARGILMAVESCTAEHAWEILRDASQHANTKLRTVATAIVAGTDGPPLAEPLRTALHDAATRQRSRRQ